MPKATKVGKFRAASRASSRDVRAAPLTSQQLSSSSSQKKKDANERISDHDLLDADAIINDATAPSLFPREGDDEPLSRGQRKRLAKRDQYLKRENMVLSSLRLKRLEGQVGKLDGLDAIREALGVASSSSSSSSSGAAAVEGGGAKKVPPTCDTNKSRRALANAEISHMGLVLRHPAFNEDPFEAIRQHLRNSLAGDAEKLDTASKARDEEDGKLDAKKKEEKKERLRDAKFSNKKRRTFRSRPRR